MAKFQTRSIILGVLLTFSYTLVGRNFPLQHFTTENDLPSNTIYRLYYDSKGFLWIGTDKGIVKYNGLEFERFTTSDGLADNEIFSFQEDYEGRLWMSTYNGELCFYKDGTFHTWINTPYLKKSASHSFIDCITIEKDSSIIILHRDKSFVLNIKGNKCNSFLLKKDKYLFNYILHLNKISENRYQVICRDQSFIIDTVCNVIANSLHRNNESFLVSFDTYKKYFFSAKGIYSNNQELQMKFGKALATLFIYSIYSDKNNWFIGTGNGLFINNDIQILQGNTITSVLQDTEKKYWISTLDNGIYCLEKNYSNTNEYNSVYTGKIKYAKAIGKYLFFTTDKSNFYRFENGKAILLFDYFKNFGKHFKNKNEWEFHISPNTFGEGIDDKYRYYNIESNFSFIIDKINSNTPAVHVFEKGKFLYTNIKELLFGRDTIYIRTPDSISIIAQSKVNPHQSLKIYKVRNAIKRGRVFGVALAPDNTLWYSSADNVNKIISLTAVPQKQFGSIIFKWMQIAGIYVVGITPNNQLLICRNFENKNISVESIAGENFVWDKLYKLNDTTFLVSTNSLYRLLSLHTNTKPVIRVIENNSLPMLAEYICSNDSICFFFKKGTITCIPINDLFIQHQAPVIFFNTFKTRNNTYPIKNEMVIRYNESKNISISFSPFSFGSKSIICEYSISKDSTDYWRPLNNNEINLFDAGYGDYVVKVKAKTLSGDFSPPYVFSFTISKPFWATWWFFMLVGLAVGGIIFYIIRINQKRVAREKNYLEKELSALRLQMNPHFLFNTLNSIYSLSKIKSSRTPDVVHKLSEMLRYVTYKSGKPLTTISEEMEMIDTYMELQMVRFESKVTIKKDISIDEPATMIVPLLLLPLIENAFKHGIGTREDNSFIHISIVLKQKILRMEVRNSIAPESVTEEGYEGLGIPNTRRQLALLYKEYELTTSDSTGIFVLELMINTNSYARIKLSDSRR